MEIQRTAILFVFKNVFVNPFMTYSYIHIFLHPSAYLFRTPFLTNQLFNIRPGAPVNTETNFTFFSAFSKSIRLLIPISSTATISDKLSTYGRFMNSNYFSNLYLTISYFKHSIYYVSLFQRELAVVFHLCSSFLTVGKVRSLQRLRFFHNQSLSCT